MKRSLLFHPLKDGEINPIMPIIELLGDGRVLVERHKGVLGYSRQRVCVKLSFGVLVVGGCSLEISRMSKTQIVISGRILELQIKRGGL